MSAAIGAAQAAPGATLRRWLLDPRPAFYALQPHKEALVAQLGEDAAAARLMQTAGLAGAWRAERLALRSLLSHAHAHAAMFEELAPSRMVQVPSLRAVAGPDLPGGGFRSRSFFRAVLGDATVYSKSNVVRAQDVALLDFQAHELQPGLCRLDTDAAVIAAGAGSLSMIERADGAHAAVGEALSLLGLHSYAFGHWIAELLPKLWACLHTPGFERVTVLVDEQMPAQHFEALRLMLRTGHPVRVVRPGERVRVARLWVVSAPVYFPIGPSPQTPAAPGSLAVDPGVYTALLETVQARLPDPPASRAPQKLFLARSDRQHRRMLNREPVEAWHREQGFAVHDFAELGFEAQWSLLRGSRCIVGPEGSALFGTFFAQADTRIAILSGPTLDLCEGYAQVTEALGQRLRVLQGTQPAERVPGQYFNDYVIDATLLPRMLAQLQAP